MNPIVSIVIPAYNSAAFIERTLDSVNRQSFRNFEVIVVDDGSLDDTQKIVDSFFRRNAMNGQCIRQDNKKIAGARNTGIRVAKGDYIALLDSDDVWYPEKLAVVMKEFESHPHIDLICHNENIVRKGCPVKKSRYGPAVPMMYERLLFKGNTLSPSATVLKKEKAILIGGFCENANFNTVEDYDFWLRLSRVAKFHFLNQTLGEYQVVEGSASRQIEYHSANHEALVKDHLDHYFCDKRSILVRLRMRKCVSRVYRATVFQLIHEDGSSVKLGKYLLKMLITCPLDLKNIASAFIAVAYVGKRATQRFCKQMFSFSLK
jgi:glycosyltransferase involved in cell wall biosynthesis